MSSIPPITHSLNITPSATDRISSALKILIAGTLTISVAHCLARKYISLSKRSPVHRIQPYCKWAGVAYFVHKTLHNTVGLVLFQAVRYGRKIQRPDEQSTLVLEDNKYKFTSLRGETGPLFGLWYPNSRRPLNVKVDGSPISVIANLINNESKNWMLVTLGNAELVSESGWMRFESLAYKLDCNMLIMDPPPVGTYYSIPGVSRSTVLKAYQAMIKFMAVDLQAEKVVLMGWSLGAAITGDALRGLNLKEMYPKCQFVAIRDRSFSTFPKEAASFIRQLGNSNIEESITGNFFLEARDGQFRLSANDSTFSVKAESVNNLAQTLIFLGGWGQMQPVNYSKEGAAIPEVFIECASNQAKALELQGKPLDEFTHDDLDSMGDGVIGNSASLGRAVLEAKLPPDQLAKKAFVWLPFKEHCGVVGNRRELLFYGNNETQENDIINRIADKVNGFWNLS